MGNLLQNCICGKFRNDKEMIKLIKNDTIKNMEKYPIIDSLKLYEDSSDDSMCGKIILPLSPLSETKKHDGITPTSSNSFEII